MLNEYAVCAHLWEGKRIREKERVRVHVQV